MNTAQVQRFDYSELKAHLDTDGFLHDSPIVARVGIQEYRTPTGGVRRELRLPENVFNTDSLASMRGKPLTVDHPKAGRVTSKDAHRVTVGTILSAGRQDGDNVRVDVVIHSPDALGDRKELSLGYLCVMDETPGEHPVYGRYDAIQGAPTVNHLSVVKSGRAGVAKLNLDSNEEPFFNQQEQQPMNVVKVKLDSGLEYDAAPEVSVELQKLRTDVSEAHIKLKAIPTLEAERDTLKARVDGFGTELATARAEGKAQAEARVKLDAVAVLMKVDTKDLSERQIKEAVIKAVTPKMNLDGKDDAYVNVAFDMAVEMRGDAAMQKQRIDANTRNDGKAPETSAAKREAMIARTLEKK